MEPIINHDPLEIIESPINEVALELARNAKHLTPKAQNALALYIEEMSKPVITSTPADIWLDKAKKPQGDNK